ncbi:hypothetical protein [Pararhodobacter oceanensis]|uniref:hypothetical protein n=1 Tax=Pararhodobacter oceanensis TaxID=2172121 RepID=UPI003A8DE00F
MASNRRSRKTRIRDSAEALFGQKITEVSAPGGSSRSSLRFHFAEHTVIGTLRPNFRRTHLEAYVLRALAPYTDDIPRCLGVDGEIMFQSDVGARRLNTELFKLDPAAQQELVAEAMAGIFRIQHAARQTDLHDKLPHLGNNPDWLANLADGVATLVPFKDADIPAQFDAAAVVERLTHQGLQFVKWDCRTGNAAIGDDEKLRWFDFEYAGLRHGAEDLAWLIADESLPVDGPRLDAMVRDALPRDPAGGVDDYMEYLAVYTVFHALQRLELIVSEARKRGWLRIEHVLGKDDVGAHPLFAANLCRTGAYFASQSVLTEMLVGHFEAAVQVFERILETGSA